MSHGNGGEQPDPRRPCRVGDAPQQGLAFNPRAGPCTITPSGAVLLILPSPVTTVPEAFPVGPQLIPNPSGVRPEGKQRSQVLRPNSLPLPPQRCPSCSAGAILSTHHSKHSVGLSPQAGGQGQTDRAPRAGWTNEAFMGSTQRWRGRCWLQSLRNGPGQSQREGENWNCPLSPC